MLPQLTLLVQPTQLVLNIAQIDLRDKLLETVPPFQSHGQLRVLIASQMSIQLKPVPHGHMPSVKLLLHGHKTSLHQTFQLLLLPSPQLVLNTAQTDQKEKPLEEELLELFHSQIKDSTATQICIQVSPELHGHMPSVKLLPHGHKTSSQLTSQLLPLTSIQMDSNIAQTFQRDKLSETVLPSQSSSQQKVPTANKISTQVKKVPQLHTIDRDYCDFEPFI
jgi:hypothetical protein